MQGTALQSSRQHFYGLAAAMVTTIILSLETLHENPNLLIERNLEEGPTELIEYLMFGMGLAINVPPTLDTSESLKTVIATTGQSSQEVLDLLFKVRLFVLHPADDHSFDKEEVLALHRFCDAVNHAEQTLS